MASSQTQKLILSVYDAVCHFMMIPMDHSYQMIVTKSLGRVFMLLQIFMSIVISKQEVPRTNELRYTVQEERARVMIGNIFVDASLHNKYSAGDLLDVQFQFLTENNGIDVNLTTRTG